MEHIKKFKSFNEGVAYKDTKKKHEKSDDYGNKKEDFRKKIKDFIKSLGCITKQVGNDLEMSYKGKYIAQIMFRDDYIGIKKESNKFPKEFKYNELGKVKEELKSLIKTNENVKEGRKNMIWLFKVNEMFHGNKPKVNDYYLFDIDDINFDITKYDISLYFGTSNYYIMSESNIEEVFQLRLEGINRNPDRILLPQNTEIYHVIKEFYIKESQK